MLKRAMNTTCFNCNFIIHQAIFTCLISSSFGDGVSYKTPTSLASLKVKVTGSDQRSNRAILHFLTDFSICKRYKNVCISLIEMPIVYDKAKPNLLRFTNKCEHMR